MWKGPIMVASSHLNSADRIRHLSTELDTSITRAGSGIETVNSQARLLAINIQIEAARLGLHGRAFQVLGNEMVTFSAQTGVIAKDLRERTKNLVDELSAISARLATEVKGTRLADLALANIDLIDRNLYERSCDCRWWATDGAFVARLENPSEKATRYASERMAVILKAYTVYFDIVLTDLAGRVLANGRPGDYASVGQVVAQQAWFRSALACADGESFGFQSVHDSALVNGERVLVYACKVCRGGDAKGEPLGVLGVVFRWNALAEKIMASTAVDEADRPQARAFLADPEGTVLADSRGGALREPFRLPNEVLRDRIGKGYFLEEAPGGRRLIAYARAPGFETYSTGWYSFVTVHLPG